MPLTTVTISISNSSNRVEVRKRVIDLFMEEPPGKGGGELASKYIYYVEQLANGKWVYLTRPANLKKGFDFLVRVQGVNFSKGVGRDRDFPKHSDIIEDLQSKKDENPENYRLLYSIIQKLYTCEDVTIADYKDLNFHIGYPTDLVLFTLKWLFIEQDIRDWSYSGRDMLMAHLPNP